MKISEYYLKYVFFVVVAFGSLKLNAQMNTPKSAKDVGHFLYFGAGPSFLYGDLGGKDRLGTHNRPADLDFPGVRFETNFGYRWQFIRQIAISTTFRYALLYGSDNLTQEPYRRNRNLTVRTHTFEFTPRLEFSIFQYSNIGYTARYKMQGVKGLRIKNIRVYVASGVSIVGFVPQGPLGGSWVNLRPLNTEGQGLTADNPEQYKLFSYGVPLALGVKLGLNKLWSLGIELSHTQLFTDYLDDAGGVYFDNTELESSYGGTSAYFADPSSGAFPSWTSTGELRGDAAHNDGYTLLSFTAVRSLGQKQNKRINLYRKRKRGRKAYF